jgi:hypothetical protein
MGTLSVFDGQAHFHQHFATGNAGFAQIKVQGDELTTVVDAVGVHADVPEILEERHDFVRSS